MRFLGALPNPAHGGVRLGFELPVKSEIRLEVFDVQGRRVRRFDQPYPAGLHFLDWDRRDASGVHLAPGVYRVRFTAAGRSQTKAVVLLP